jgi:hypothetical protein
VETQLISHSPSIRLAVSGQTAGDPVFNGEEVESRLAALNQRYATVAAAVAEAGMEFRRLRRSQSASASAVEARRRQWIRLEQWRRSLDAAIERLED